MTSFDDDVESAFRALASDRRLLILEWLKRPKAHFPPQVDGDLVRDGVCGVFIAEKLGVSHVLEGSVRKAGGRVRINAQLIDAASGGHVWADRYDGDLKNIFGLQDTVTRNGLWYNGKPTEDASGLSYYGGRWYNPAMGRFYSVDSVERRSLGQEQPVVLVIDPRPLDPARRFCSRLRYRSQLRRISFSKRQLNRPPPRCHDFSSRSLVGTRDICGNPKTKMNPPL